jgi:hypothetical protein
MGLAALGLALCAPTVGWAQQAAAPAPPPANAPAAANLPQHTHRRNFFGKEILCTECLRARAMARSGQYIPPAPPLPPTDDGKLRDGFCLNCVQGGTVAVGTTTGGEVVAGRLVPGPVVQGGPVVAQARKAPGRAVVGGDAPGYASVGGDAMLASEPTPIGRTMMTQAWANARQPAPNRQAKAPSDSALMPTSFNPVAPEGSNNPHILRHLFGLDAIGSLSRREAERRAREKHAAIAYGQKDQPVTELPASMVYTKR